MNTNLTRILVSALALIGTAAIAADLHVAPNGNDANPGTQAKPFATLERARDEVRTIKNPGAGGVTVWIQPGTYVRSQTLEFTSADSGTEKTPVIYCAAAGGEVRLHAGRMIKPTDFTPVTKAGVVSRLDAAARGKVVQLDLAALGIKNAGPFPKVFNDGGGVGELFFNDQRMPLSRWPNEGNVTMGKVLDRGDWSKGPGRHGGKFIAREDRVARWRTDGGVWLEGYWRVPWEPWVVQVKSIVPATHEITFADPVNGGIGSKYAKAGELGDGKEPWCAVNLLEEIDQPGEWCVDFASRTLYFWPPGDLSRASVYLSDFNHPMVAMRGAANVTLRGLVFEGGLGNGVEITGGDGGLIAGSTFRNLGGGGVIINGGSNHGVRSSDFYELGRGGVYFSGGDRKTLTPAHHFAENNHLYRLGIRKKTYAAAINVGNDSVGCRVAHNFMHDLPHAAVLYTGNDHLFEFNEVARVALTSGDVGAFYTCLDWTSRGNVLRYNFVHDSPRANAFYLDDGDSGDTVYGNVVFRCSYGPFISGGHDNIVQNNLVIDTARGLHIDTRGVSRGYATNQNLIRRLLSINPQQPPWSTRYPTLAKLINGRRDVPTGNVIENNATVACKQPLHFDGKPEHLAFSTLRNNLILTEAEAGFVDAAKLDFRLRPDSAVFKQLPAFKPIPFEQIGLQRDADRTVLPDLGRSRAAGAGSGSVFDSNTDMQRSNQSPKP
ncbi:MAG: right-handed parallel beta-helix repeat-containing protein [Verrucomicrobiota bacterium]